MNQIYFIFEWHSTCFGRSFRPSLAVHDCTYSSRHMTNRYCCLLASKQTAVSVTRSSGRQQYQCIVPKAVRTVRKCSWGWASLSTEICRAYLKRSISGICCIFWLLTSLFIAFISQTFPYIWNPFFQFSEIITRLGPGDSQEVLMRFGWFTLSHSYR